MDCGVEMSVRPMNSWEDAVMVFTRVLAQATVSDLERAIDWYSTLFGRQPDSRPMPGLVEWHLGKSHGVQVWAEPDRAGNSSMVLDEPDFDDLVVRLDAAGFRHDPPEDVTASRILSLVDPDGNRIVVSGPFSDA
jgi:predicted enzyme related to lactoylglutathione lyase